MSEPTTGATSTDQENPPSEVSTLSGFVKRGIAAGGIAGALSALYLLFVVKGTINEALGIEAARHGDDGNDQEAIFGRTTQIVGGMTAGLLYGLVAGLIFSIVFVKLRHRLYGRDDFTRAMGLAAIGFLTIALIPALKYPANPPGVGDPDTVNARTVGYVTLMAFGIVLLVLAWKVLRWLTDRGIAGHSALVLAGAFFVVAISAAWLAWTPAEAVPDDMPAQLVWRFRVLSLGGLALQWTLIGVVFGLLTTSRLVRSRPERQTPTTS